MSTFILLTAEQADRVRGLSVASPYAALNPIACPGGVFLLGADVLFDPAHEAHREFLATLPEMEDADPDFPPKAGEQDE